MNLFKATAIDVIQKIENYSIDVGKSASPYVVT